MQMFICNCLELHGADISVHEHTVHGFQRPFAGLLSAELDDEEFGGTSLA